MAGLRPPDHPVLRKFSSGELDEERKQNEERIKAALQEQVDAQKTMLETCLQAEKEKNKLELEKAIQVGGKFQSAHLSP